MKNTYIERLQCARGCTPMCSGFKVVAGIVLSMQREIDTLKHKRDELQSVIKDKSNEIKEMNKAYEGHDF